MTEFLLVSTTTDSRDKAQTLASALVEQELAACVQIQGPIESVYRWQGTVEQSQEWLLTAKTKSSDFDNVEAAIRELHTYDCPEIVATAIVAGSDDYLKWLGDSC